MEQLGSLQAMLRRSAAQRAQGLRIGLIPTMGFLHEGHLALVDRIRPHVDRVWLSIFVNPAQFGPAEDLDRYPRDRERDLALCAARGVDGVFLPVAAEVYPPGHQTWVTPGPVAERYCGASRPGHFRGVLSIVQRLFRWTNCTHAVFGAKDAQQLWLIKRMTKDLELGVQILESPTIREADGLAMSSRNVFLGPEERMAAPALQVSLKQGAEALRAGETPGRALEQMRQQLARTPLIELEYLHVADWKTLASLAGEPRVRDWEADQDGAVREELILLAAVRIGRTRLIDNLRIKLKDLQ